VTFRFADRDLNDAELAGLAFRVYTYADFIIPKAWQEWRAMMGDAFTRRDFVCLLLYYLDKVASPDLRQTCEDDLDKIKRELQP